MYTLNRLNGMSGISLVALGNYETNPELLRTLSV